jgi:hypothetical protein
MTDGMSGARRSSSASTRASSIATHPLCPIIGDIAWAASPMSTTRPADHVTSGSHSTDEQ